MRLPFAAVLVSTGLAASLSSIPARAADVSLAVGRSYTTHTLETTSVFVNLETDRRLYWHGLRFAPVVTAGWIEGRQGALVRRQHLRRNVYVLGAGLRLEGAWPHGFASFQLGAAFGRTAALSSGAEFISSLGWRGPHGMVMIRHISNGNLFGGKNRGETMFMVGLRF